MCANEISQDKQNTANASVFIFWILVMVHQNSIEFWAYDWPLNSSLECTDRFVCCRPMTYRVSKSPLKEQNGIVDTILKRDVETRNRPPPPPTFMGTPSFGEKKPECITKFNLTLEPLLFIYKWSLKLFITNLRRESLLTFCKTRTFNHLLWAASNPPVLNAVHRRKKR